MSGVECVGLVKSCSGGEFPLGAKMAALMGDLGRTINGSYAEYTRTRPGPVCSAIFRSNAVSCSSSGRQLLIRPSRAQDGRQDSVRVIATTRDRDHWPMLEKLGAERDEIERRDLSKQRVFDDLARLKGGKLEPGRWLAPTRFQPCNDYPALPPRMVVRVRVEHQESGLPLLHLLRRDAYDKVFEEPAPCTAATDVGPRMRLDRTGEPSCKRC